MEENSMKNDYELTSFEIEMLFKESDIEEIWNHSNPILNVYDLIHCITVMRCHYKNVSLYDDCFYCC